MANWGSWSVKPEPIKAEEITKTIDCDVLVLGAGISGMTCALRAAQGGNKVIVMEKHRTWSARGGNIAVINSSFLKAQGHENDPAEVAREWIKRCGNRCDEELLWVFLNRGGDAMDWLMDIVTSEEYNCRPELQAAFYQGETYYEIFGSHRFFDGPMHKKGMRAGAADAVYAMYQEAVKLGAEFLFSCPACEITKDGDRVTGAIGKAEEGYIKVNAKKGVVIATGDIGGNDEMCADLAPMANRCASKIYTPKGGNMGDGHRLGLWAGGSFEDGPFPLMIHPQAYHFANYCFLFVDQEGKRFMNEDNYIQGKTMAILRRGMTYAWSLMDSEWETKIPATLPYGGGIFWEVDHAPGEPGFTRENTERLLEMGTKGGNVFKADTLEELAELMNVSADELKASVERYNELTKDGCDKDFGKRKELMIPVDKPPYYAMKFGPALLAVVGGLRVNTKMQVLNDSFKPVEGLYAIGNAAAGRYGVDYPMLLPGNSHGTALTFGYVLGESFGNK